VSSHANCLQAGEFNPAGMAHSLWQFQLEKFEATLCPHSSGQLIKAVDKRSSSNMVKAKKTP